MAEKSQSGRIRSWALGLLIAGGALTVLFILSMILMLATAYSKDASPNVWGVLAAISLVLFLPVIVVGLYFVIRLIVIDSDADATAEARLARVESLLEDQGGHLHELVQLAVLSDQAKSLIYYEQEIEAFRETVNAMLLKQDYQSAEAMIARMEKQFGLVEEASRMRDEVTSYRQKTVSDKLDSAVERIDDILSRQQWAQAKREAERLAAMFPDNDRVRELPARIQGAWNDYKRQLLKDYGEAVRINDVERSIDLLKELDRYLTPQEGAALSESARGVFKAKLHNLGVQFAISVTDRQWTDAVATGEQIMAEFPNSRMAREVGAKLDLLRAYATGEKQPPAPQQFVGGPAATG